MAVGTVIELDAGHERASGDEICGAVISVCEFETVAVGTSAPAEKRWRRRTKNKKGKSSGTAVDATISACEGLDKCGGVMPPSVLAKRWADECSDDIKLAVNLLSSKLCMCVVQQMRVGARLRSATVPVLVLAR